MISEIRQHVRDAMKAIDSGYLENDRPFEDLANIVNTKVDKTYHLEIGTANKEVEDELLGAVFNVDATLRLYALGGRNKLETFDEAYCHALLVNLKILDRLSITNRDYIKGITSSSVDPSEIDGSQDLYSFETTLTFKISYAIGD